jgi:rubrerythrin
MLERQNAMLAEHVSQLGTFGEWFLGSLGVLFTAGGIFFAGWLYRQSREHRETINRLEADYRAKITEATDALEGSVAHHNRVLQQFIDEQKQTIERQIVDATARLDAAEKDGRAAVQAQIDELRKEKVRLENVKPPAANLGFGMGPLMSGLGSLGKNPGDAFIAGMKAAREGSIRNCRNCGRAVLSLSGKEPLSCPACKTPTVAGGDV